MPYTVDRPSPVPLPFSLVVKKGSKIRARVFASIPIPVSLTASSTYAPGTTGWCASAYCSLNSALSVSRSSLPPVRPAPHRLRGQATGLRHEVDHAESLGWVDVNVGHRPPLQIGLRWISEHAHERGVHRE